MPNTNPSSASSNAGAKPSRQMAFTVAGLAVFAVIAGTRAIVVSKAERAPERAAAVATATSPSAPMTSEAPAAPAASPIVEQSAGASSPSSSDAPSGAAATSTRKTTPASAAVATSEAGPRATDASDASAAPSAPVASPANAESAPTTSAPAEAAPAGPINRGPLAQTPLDWRAIIGHAGVAVAFSEITDASTGSGQYTGAHAARTISNVAITLDLDTLLGVRGMKVFGQHKSKTGRNGSAEGSFTQNFSNIDADDFRALGEVWVEQRLFSDRLRVKAGRVDFNSEFAGTDNGGGFLNASMGYSPSIAAAPTFPLPTSGLNVFVAPRENLTIGVGVFDGRDGAPAAEGSSSRFQIAQVKQAWTVGAAALSGRVGIGAWRHTGMFTSQDAEEGAEPDVKGTGGWYATLDQNLWQGAPRGSEGASPARIAAFAQIGRSNRQVQIVQAHTGAGVTFAGMLAKRPGDVLGLGVTKAGRRDGGETIEEMYYQLPVTSHFSFVADVQHVDSRDLVGDRRRGMVSTLRSIINF